MLTADRILMIVTVLGLIVYGLGLAICEPCKALLTRPSSTSSVVRPSGRGVTPVWMRDEMKGTKLKKEDLLIA